MEIGSGADVAAPAPTPLGAGLRRRWWLILVCALLGVAAGGLAISLVPPAYRTTSTVLVTPTGAESLTSSTGQSKDGLVNLETEAQIVTSSEVVERARALLKTPRTGGDLAGDISVEVPPNTAVLAITAEASTAAGAQQEARAFTKAYLDLRAGTANAAIDQQVKSVQGQIAAVSKSLQRVAGQAAALPSDSPDQAFADAQKRILTDQITTLSGTVSQLEAVTVTPGRILNDAALPTAPSQPVPALYLTAGTLAGLVIGVALALLVARLDRRLRSPAEIERLGDVGLLGTVPAAGSAGGDSRLVAPIASTIGQAFGRIRNSVVTAMPDRPAVLMVAGTDDGSAAPLVAANLAAALARAGLPTVLVCADFTSFDAERLTGLSRSETGLSEALSTGGDPQRHLRPAPSIPGLQVLGSGRDTAAAAELLQTRRFADVLAAVKPASFVVVEAPPTSAGADAQAMGRMSDAVLLVAELGRSRIDAVEDAAGQFSRVGTPVLGVVVTARQHTPRRATRPEGSGEAPPAVASAPGPQGWAVDGPAPTPPTERHGVRERSVPNRVSGVASVPVRPGGGRRGEVDGSGSPAGEPAPAPESRSPLRAEPAERTDPETEVIRRRPSPRPSRHAGMRRVGDGLTGDRETHPATPGEAEKPEAPTGSDVTMRLERIEVAPGPPDASPTRSR